VPSWADSKEEIEEEKAEIRNMVKETLAWLYKYQPSAKKAVSKSAGYGVFKDYGIGMAAGGKGLVIDSKTKKETFMKMVEMHAGIRVGLRKVRLVWVFENHEDLSKIIDSGWEFGADKAAAAKVGEEGSDFVGAMSVSPGVWLYKLSHNGLVMELSGHGSKYFKDDDLN
jgi:lipid-binding SYLF domain-containing protein